MYWIPTVMLLAHVAEEFPRFPAWATRHFGTTSRAWYVYSHIALIALSVTVSAQAQVLAPRTAWPILALALQWGLAINSLFHITTSVLFREYSPGVVTGTVLCLAATAYLFHHALVVDLLTISQVVSAVALGTVFSAAAIASLWLRMDFDWKFRRPSSKRGDD